MRPWLRPLGMQAAFCFFTTSFGIGIPIAADALVARALGSGDEVLAGSKASHALIYGVVLGPFLRPPFGLMF